MQSAWLDTAVQLRQLPVAADIQRSLASSRACGRAIQALEHQDFYFAYCQLQFGHACNSDLAIQVVAAEIKLSEAGLALLDDLMAKNYMTVSTGQCASSDHLRTGLGLSELGVPLALGSHWIHTRFALDSLWIRPRSVFALDSPSIRPGFALRSRFALDSLPIHSRFALPVRCELCRQQHSHGLMAATTRRSPSRLTSPLWVSGTCCKQTSPRPSRVRGQQRVAGQAAGWLLFVFGLRCSLSPQLNWR